MKKLSNVVVSVAATAAGLAIAQTPSAPLVKQTFADGQGAWTVFGGSGSIAIAHDAPIVAAGSAALKFSYNVGKGDISALVFPTDVGSIARAKSLKFRLRSDSTTMVAVMLQEQGGGRYVAMCTVPKDKWQPIELSTADFALAQEKDDPKDPDGKLDLDQVSGVVVTDVAQMFAQSDDAGLRSLFGIRNGAHALYLDDFTISADTVQAATSTTGGDVMLETFAHPQLSWFGINGSDLVRSSGAPMAGAAVKFSYHQSPGKMSLLSRTLAPGLLATSKSLSFDLASSQPAKIVVQVEETDGGKYNMLIDVPGSSEPKHFDLPFYQFKPSDDSKDSNGTLDVEKIKTLLIMDGSGMLLQADHDNTLWLNHVIAHH